MITSSVHDAVYGLRMSIIAVLLLHVLNVTTHLTAATLAGTRRVPADVLISIAKVESDLWPTAPVSRPHGRSTPPFYCGPLQTISNDERQCRTQTRDVFLGYQLGAAELEEWLDDPRVHNNMRRALLGHGCGNLGLYRGRCAVDRFGRSYDDRVMMVLRDIQAAKLPPPPNYSLPEDAIYCTGGAHPIRNARGVAVGCQRVGS